MIYDRYVKMLSLKQLLRSGKIDLIHVSDDGEFMRFKILPNGPEVGMWVPDGPQLVVDCETVHVNFLNAYPQLFEEVPNESNT